MDICFVINTLDYGGAAKMMKFVINSTLDLFDKVTVLSLFHSNNKYDDLSSRVEVINLNNRFSGIFRRLNWAKQIRSFVYENKPAIICSFISDVCFTTRIAVLGIRNIKVVSAERGDPYELSPIWTRISKWVYSSSDYCFFQLKNVRDFDGRTDNNSFVIPNAISDLKNPPSFQGDRKKTIVSFGRLFDKQKKFSVLIRAFLNVHAVHNDYTLTIYGDGQDRDYLQSLISELGLSDCVFLPGAIKNPRETIIDDGVFVLSSAYEGIPNSLIEALSVGIPTVTTDCSPGGARFLTNNGKNALLVPVNNPKVMADAICRIIESPDLAKDLSTKGPSVLKDLDEGTIKQMWINAFRRIADING